MLSQEENSEDTQKFCVVLFIFELYINAGSLYTSERQRDTGTGHSPVNI